MKVADKQGHRASGTRSRRDRSVVLACLAAVGAMGALSYAAVPLYRMFCQVTGYAGTTQKAERASDVVLDRMVTVRFDANVTPGMAWEFEPEQRTMRVKVGENVLAFYKASNKSDKALTGEASFNVSPEIAGSYFAKIECFCFKEQTLEAGETVEMPVSFFVDPKIAENRDADGVHEITLSYTFYPAKARAGSAAAVKTAREAGQGS
jgi:cytochrome c oxidase assembly protein subunit 11